MVVKEYVTNDVKYKEMISKMEAATNNYLAVKNNYKASQEWVQEELQKANKIRREAWEEYKDTIRARKDEFESIIRQSKTVIKDEEDMAKVQRMKMNFEIMPEGTLKEVLSTFQPQADLLESTALKMVLKERKDDDGVMLLEQKESSIWEVGALSEEQTKEYNTIQSVQAAIDIHYRDNYYPTEDGASDVEIQ